jgi:O-antigen/teichoic acid export membrane protein
MCLPKAFLKPVRSLLQSHEKQTYLILALVVAAIADFSVAWYLIPANGAVGACIGSGVGQTTALGIMWIVGIRLFKVKLPWGMIAKITASSVAAALTAHYIALQLAPLWGILCGGTASLLVLFTFFYILRVLEPEDHIRLSAITRMLPRQLAAPADSFLHFLVRPAMGGIIDEEDSPRPAKEA